MRKFKDKEKTIFDDEQLLKDYLVEFEDIGMSYKINYNIQQGYDGELYSIKSTNYRPDKWRKTLDTYRAYVIVFEDFVSVETSDQQRNGRCFSKIDNKVMGTLKLASELSLKVKQLGYTVLISFDDPNRNVADKFSIMIIEKVI